MSKKLKENAVKELSQRYQSMDHCFIVNYRGMNATNINNLRFYLKEGKVKINVVRNSLLKNILAKKGPSFSQLDTFMDGPIALIYSNEVDGIATVKRLVSWSNKNKLPEIKGGYVEGNIVTINDIKKLSQLPSREILLTQIAIALKSPTTRLAVALSDVIARLARVLNQKASSN
ncbi:MAG: 50S ribosomal protein L10 [Planctomycetota bacterium]